MLKWQIAAKIFDTAGYFMGNGALICAAILAGRGAIVGLLGGFLHSANRGWLHYTDIVLIVLQETLTIAFAGAVFGLLFGSVLFFPIGFWRGVRPDFRKEAEIDRSGKAARWAAFYCGWIAVLNGLLLMAFQGSLRDLSTISIDNWNYYFDNCFRYLALGNLFGIILGAVSPGSIERTRAVIKSAFASVRRT